MLSIMAVNNETGVVQDWQEIDTLAGRTIVHTDAAQALGKLPKLPKRPDLVTLSSHKVHGPQGIGALLLRQGSKPAALLRGGGQQAGLRSGTLPTALCVGFGICCEVAQTSLADDLARIADLSEYLLREVRDLWPGAKRVGESCVAGCGRPPSAEQDAHGCSFPGQGLRCTHRSRIPCPACHAGS